MASQVKNNTPRVDDSSASPSPVAFGFYATGIIPSVIKNGRLVVREEPFASWVVKERRVWIDRDGGEGRLTRYVAEFFVNDNWDAEALAKDLAQRMNRADSDGATFAPLAEPDAAQRSGGTTP